MPSLMAFFKRKEKVPTEVERLDWRLLERGAVALYYKGVGAVAGSGMASPTQVRVHELDAARGTSRATFTLPRRRR